jgi:hypothetical protein
VDTGARAAIPGPGSSRIGTNADDDDDVDVDVDDDDDDGDLDVVTCGWYSGGGTVAFASMSPLPSNGAPVASTTRPATHSPVGNTGTSPRASERERERNKRERKESEK